jgi:hypothetical protein
MRSTPAVFSENRYLDGSDIGDRQEADCRFRELQQIEWPYMDSSSLTSERLAKSRTTALVYSAS